MFNESDAGAQLQYDEKNKSNTWLAKIHIHVNVHVGLLNFFEYRNTETRCYKFGENSM